MIKNEQCDARDFRQRMPACNSQKVTILWYLNIDGVGRLWGPGKAVVSLGSRNLNSEVMFHPDWTREFKTQGRAPRRARALSFVKFPDVLSLR